MVLWREEERQYLEQLCAQTCLSEATPQTKHTRRKPSGGASGLNLVPLAVRGHLDDGRGGALPVVNKAELDAEE